MSLGPIPTDLRDVPQVCVYCDRWADMRGCRSCGEYKGLMTVASWERYTGQTWDGWDRGWL